MVFKYDVWLKCLLRAGQEIMVKWVIILSNIWISKSYFYVVLEQAEISRR